MEAWSLMLGIVAMLVAPLGIVLYVALVVAIPVCRALDWLLDPQTEEQGARSSSRAGPGRPGAGEPPKRPAD